MPTGDPADATHEETMAEQTAITLPNNLIEPLIRAEITAALSRALGSQQQLIDAVAAKIVNDKVDSDGRPSSYGNSVPFIEWLTKKKLYEFIAELLKEELESLRPVFRSALLAQMKKDKSAITQAFVEGMLTHHISDGRIRYNLTISGGHS
jgi:hypothetical protein